MKCLCPGVFMTFSLMRAYIIFNPFELARLLTYHIIWGQSVLPASVWTLAKWLIIRVKLASASSLYSYSFAVTHFYTSGRKPRTKYQSLSHLKKTPILMVSFSLYGLPLLSYLFSTSFVFLLFLPYFISPFSESLFTVFCISLCSSLPVFRTISRISSSQFYSATR